MGKIFLDFLDFHILPQISFTTSETELDYYHQKVNVWVAWRIPEKRKTEDLERLVNFKRIPGMHVVDGKYPAGNLKDKICQLRWRTAKNEL